MDTRYHLISPIRREGRTHNDITVGPVRDYCNFHPTRSRATFDGSPYALTPTARSLERTYRLLLSVKAFRYNSRFIITYIREVVNGKFEKSPLTSLFNFQALVKLKEFARVNVSYVRMTLQGNVEELISLNLDVFQSLGAEIVFLAPIIMLQDVRHAPTDARLEVK